MTDNVAFFAFPRVCPNVRAGKCEIIRENVEHEVRLSFGGWTRWNCDGAWTDDNDNVVQDENFCYIVGKRLTKATQRKRKLERILKAAKDAGENAVAVKDGPGLRLEFAQPEARVEGRKVKLRQVRL